MTRYQTAILNQRFGRLTVIECLGINKWHQNVWRCQCDCGKETTALISPLKSGNKRSCGCLEVAKGKENTRWRGYEDLSLTRFTSIRLGAKKRGLEFTITIKDAWDLFLQQNKKCALSGINLAFGLGKWDSTANASLDRIDSSKGYTKDNIQWVDKRVNFMKQEFSLDEFKDLCKKVADYGTLIK